MTRARIQLSPRGKVIYQFLSLIVVLLVLYGIAIVLSALSLVPRQLTAVFSQFSAQQFAEPIFSLLCLTGFISAGIMMSGAAAGEWAAKGWQRAWIAAVALMLILSLAGAGILLDVGTAILLLAVLAWSLSTNTGSTFVRVWQLGLLLMAISLPAEHVASGEMAAALGSFRIQVAYGLCALSMASWLMPRYSSLSSAAAQANLRIVAVMLSLGGSLISLGHLDLPAVVGLSATPLVALCYVIMAAQLARSLRDRNENASLASHWIALATLLWLVSGLLGALSSYSGISQALGNTDFSAAQIWLAGWAIVSIVLAFCNEAATALRGDNRRVTGYVPLWLVGFGVGLASVAQLCRGVVQFYLRQFALEATVSEAELLLPITLVWITCLLAMLAGILAYALGFFLRRPQIRVVEP